MIVTSPRCRAALLLATTAPLFAVHSQTAPSGARPRTAAEDMLMFSQVMNQIRVNHPDSIDLHSLYLAAVEGMVRAADPHSYVIPASRFDAAKERGLREGKLETVPIEFRFVGDSPVVVAVTPGTRTSRLDILPGDELISIATSRVAATSPAELLMALAGPRGSAVALGFQRMRPDGSIAEFVRDARREHLDEVSAVPAAFMLDASTAYVRITTFSNGKVADDLRVALEGLERAGMKRLVLDLRDNSGGLIDQAARVAGEFLPSGATVYTSTGRRADLIDTLRVTRSFWRSEKAYPMVVLVNAGTASASELVAGALQDHDRAVIVGRPTFGKALIMRGFPMTDGSLIMLVVGQLRTPCGRVVQRQYRNESTRDYYRLSVAERDTVGRPSCRTRGGRTVYGGGGIMPDVMIAPNADAPTWLARAYEGDLLLRWAGGWVSEHATEIPELSALEQSRSLGAPALASFRALAQKSGVALPSDAGADALLSRALLMHVVRLRFGDAAYYRLAARMDDDVVARAFGAFEQAAMIMRSR